jgi:hypothetical protein
MRQKPMAHYMILRRTDPFLGNDRETGIRTTAVAMKQVLNKQQLNYNNRKIVGNGVFCSINARGYK